MCRNVAQPEDFLRLAQFLRAEIEQDEAARRAIAHASSYAVYHLMATYFGVDPSRWDGASHRDIRDRLNGLRFTPPPPRHVVIARRHYRTLTHFRVWADYALNKEFAAVDARRALDMAEEIFKAAPTSSGRSVSP
jgi:hypothetical protein